MERSTFLIDKVQDRQGVAQVSVTGHAARYGGSQGIGLSTNAPSPGENTTVVK